MTTQRNDLRKKLQKKVKRAWDAQRIANDMVEEALDEFAAATADVRAENPHLESYNRFGNESRLSAMLFMDIVGYSTLEDDDKLREIILRLNKIVVKALKESGCDMDDVISLPSGDGMCLCFLSTDQALSVAVNIQEQLQNGDSKSLQLRMGLHCGNVLRVEDIKGWFGLVGDALNMTQRAMDCGDEGHILCTQEAYTQFKKRSQFKNFLKHLGSFEVKHGVNLDLYNYVCEERRVGNSAAPKKAPASNPADQSAQARKASSRSST